MGSPYIVTSVPRVNVVRTARGFRRLSQEMRRITESDFLDITEAVVAGILELEEKHLMWSIVQSKYKTMGVDGLVAFLADDIPDWNAFCVPYLDFCAIVLDCKFRLARTVVTVTTRYECSEKEHLDRAVVLDFTAK